jgi:hypothetical protein
MQNCTPCDVTINDLRQLSARLVSQLNLYQNKMYGDSMGVYQKRVLVYQKRLFF